MPGRKFVIDTSLFVNPHARAKLGKDPSSAIMGFVKLMSNSDADVYMPPSIYKELSNFAKKEAMESLDLVIKKRAPNTYSLHLPAAVFYDFIDDVRARINKGLRLAEEFAKDNRPDNDAKLSKLRDKYRDMMRTGIIDSKEDFELVILAKELDATLVSSDEGAIKFANQIGCGWLSAEKFYPLLKNLKKRKR
jgi:RNA ligase partner protein